MSKKICQYGLLAAVCMMLSYIEACFPFDFIAPGIKLGLANSVALLLIYNDDAGGAALVNLTRIFLSAILFSGISTLPFSVFGAVGAWMIMLILRRFKIFGCIGISAAGGAVHNIMQGIAAVLITGKAAAAYFPLLLLSGAVCGALTGFLVNLINKKYGTD